MYVYELARELGAESRDLIERAAAVDMGHISPNTKLSQEQILLLREHYVKSVSQSRGSLFAGGAAPPAPPPPRLPPPPPAAPAEFPGAPPDGQPEADSYASPLLKPIYDPDAQPGSDPGGGFGGPLAFDPSGTAPPGSPPSSGGPSPGSAAPLASASEYRWDEPPSWDPLPTGVGLGSGTSPSEHSRVDYAGSGYSRVDSGSRISDEEYEQRFRGDDRSPPKPSSSSNTRIAVIGVLGLIAIVITSMFAGRQLGIVGPGAERHCLITETPAERGEGVIEEIVCVDGYGKEVRREIRNSNEELEVVDFGSSAEGETTRVVRVDDFCRGAEAFIKFRDGFQAQVDSASSMVGIGQWYDENDGFGIAGQGSMVGSFGNVGPNPGVVDLAGYLEEVRLAARSGSVDQAKMLFAAAEQTYAPQILDVRNFSHSHCQ